MKIYVLNDTSHKHAGCRATMKAFYNLFKNHEIICRNYVGAQHHNDLHEAKFNECDLVVCNGEGTMHHDKPAVKFLMWALDKGQKLGKRTMLINSIWQSNPDKYKEILSKLDFLSFREILSQKEAGMGLVFPDLVFNNEYIVREKTGKDLLYIDDNFPLEGDFQILVDKMADCKHFTTTKYHGVILAIISKTPFTALSRDTHKITGLIKTAGGEDLLQYYSKAKRLAEFV